MRVLLVQLPVPQHNFGRRAGNVPLGAARLKQAADGVAGADVAVLPESLASCLGDAALLDAILENDPQVAGFTVCCWNADRTLWMAEALKDRKDIRVIFGGPEITPDNAYVASDHVDVRVFGDGEAAFQDLLAAAPASWPRTAAAPAGDIFTRSRNPYLCADNGLEPRIEDAVFIETLRGCPHSCAYCYYGKAGKGIAVAPEETVLEAVEWACRRGFSEVFLLDPCLDARPGLQGLLHGIARINADRRTAFLSEMRADNVDAGLAAAFARAGFTSFEIGLQTVNPKALALMRRPTDLAAFRKGAGLLRKAGIGVKTDLIIGLPGDDLATFRAAVDFTAENDLHHDVQVFFLSVLPGTAFRRKSAALGLRHDPRPPYIVRETPTFSREEMIDAFHYAEDRFDISLQPRPDLDLAYLPAGTDGPLSCLTVALGGRRFTYKIIFHDETPRDRLHQEARRVTRPYQIMFMPAMKNATFMVRSAALLTEENPHTPLEIVFFEPVAPPDAAAVDAGLNLRRPSYLDLDPSPAGSGAVLYTLVSSEKDRIFGGGMKRQVYRRREGGLPGAGELERLFHLDGVLMDNRESPETWANWQDEYASRADDLPLITFAGAGLQRRWTRLTSPADYWCDILPGGDAGEGGA